MKTVTAYEGQYLYPKPSRKNPQRWYFIPKADQTPEAWLKRHGAAVRVPRNPESRVGGKTEESAAHLDAAALWSEFNALRTAPEAGGAWPHGSLPWVIERYKESDRFTQLADETRKSYLNCLGQIMAWAHALADARGGIYRPINLAKPRQLQDFIDGWKDKPTRQRNLKVVLSLLFKEAILLDVATENPARSLILAKRKRGQRRKNRVALWDQTFVDNAVSEAQRRELPEVAAWIQTMWDIGRRPTDLNNLVVLDDMTRIRLERGQITEGMYYDPETQAVRGWQQKTGRFGQIPLDQMTIDLIEACRPKVEQGANHRHVFIDSRFMEPFTTERFHAQFKPVAAEVGLPETTPQMGRHSCIMRYRRMGATHEDIQEVTGHYDERTIAVYYVVEDDSRVSGLKAARAAAEGNTQ